MSASNRKVLIGNAAEEIRTLLTSSGAGGPLEAIRSIQADYGLDFPNIDSIYPLLEACGYSRLEIHQHCLKALNDEVVAFIESPAFQIEDFHNLFDKLFPYIHMEEMQPIPMALLKKFEPHIDDDTLNTLKANVNIFKNCPWNIKQRIWKQDETFFQEAMVSLLNEYHHNEELQKLALNIKPGDYNEFTRQRRSHRIVREIMKNINRDPETYKMFMRLIRIVFQNTPYTSLCSLRVDVLMNYHDQDADEITHVDRCHRLIWSLDSCVRGHRMDDVLINNIRECFNGAKRGTQLYGDFAMVLMDPLFSNLLAATIVKWLKMDILATEDNEEDTNMIDYRELIDYSAKLMNLAEQAPIAVQPGNNNNKVHSMNKELMARFWDAMTKIIKEEPFQEDFPEAMIDILTKSDIARKVFVHYLLERVQEPNCGVLNTYLALIADSWPDNKKNDQGEDTTAAAEELSGITYRQTYLTFVHTLIHILVERNYLVKCVSDPHYKPIVPFLLGVVHWDITVHMQMVHFITAYYADDKGETLMKLGPHAAELGRWVNEIARTGYRDERNMESLKEAYIKLLRRANDVRGGEFRFAAPAVVDLLSDEATA